MSPPSAGYQSDEQDILGGEEGQVVGGRVGTTQPVGAKGAGVNKTDSTQAEGLKDPIPNPGLVHKKTKRGVIKPHPTQSAGLIANLSFKTLSKLAKTQKH